uniref:SAM-dependent methyltransferase Erg6/SMT-type domain-containing protein n=1 Tax=Ananas comosus var. bracteatus TaxID=296719 RepID=A0A6V7PNT0_ANACO|nr:unnamed protein product [Ananas comosus var. bracteatus]
MDGRGGGAGVGLLVRVHDGRGRGEGEAGGGAEDGIHHPWRRPARYSQYWSFFRRPKELSALRPPPPPTSPTSSTPTTTSLPTFTEWGWGQSIHFSPAVPARSHRDATASTRSASPTSSPPAPAPGARRRLRRRRAHARHRRPLGAHIVGITINQYQVGRARAHNRKAGLDGRLCAVTFWRCRSRTRRSTRPYSIEATCHAPHLEDVYGEIFRALKPGGMTARKVGFEVVEERDLALPPAGPWWVRLKMGRLAYWRNHILLSVLTFLRIAPRGVVEVHDMLYETAIHLTRGGETGIFTPMHMILCRKPLLAAARDGAGN